MADSYNKRRTYIVAEISANHNGSYKTAEELVRLAALSGADAVKTQTYTPDTMTIDCGRSEFTVSGGTPWDGRSLYDLYRQAAMPWGWHAKLKELANSMGIDYFSSVYDQSSVDYLELVGVPAYKIASFELVDIALLEYVASKKKPVILSTGMATIDEIREAVNAVRAAGNDRITLLKCTSAYPAPYCELNLRGIPLLSEMFGVPVGLSDHTRSEEVASLAVALGATVIEKHLILSRRIDTPDAAFSAEPQEFAEMVRKVRLAEHALGDRVVTTTKSEQASTAFRRSLFTVEDIRCGERFTGNNVRSIRPGCGLHPRFLKRVLRRKASQDIERGTPLNWELTDGGVPR